MSVLIVAIVVVLISSALCSGSEAALFSIPVTRVRHLAQSQKPAAIALLRIQENMSRPIGTIVILNNIANIVGSAAVTAIAFDLWGDLGRSILSGVLTFLVILFSEIIPKTLGELYCVRISLWVARPVLFLSYLFAPILWLLEHLTQWMTPSNPRLTTNEAEIRLLANIGQREGVIEKDESEMIHRVFELNDKTAQDLMTPRVAITYLKGSETLDSVREPILNSPHSRIIVVESVPDDITGIVYKTELLSGMVEGRSDEPIANFQHRVRFVPEQMPADRLLTLFQSSRQHLAVVVDEFAGVSGVVTLEDVLEVLTGEIVDETDLIPDLQEHARRDLQNFHLNQLNAVDARKDTPEESDSEVCLRQSSEGEPPLREHAEGTDSPSEKPAD